MVSGDNPPKLKGADGYLQWKREISIWQIGTSVVEKRQASIAVLAILEQKARKFATRLDLDKLKEDTGLTYLLAELDKHFKKDKTQSVFVAIEDLESFVRGKDECMSEYIREFGRRVDIIKELLGKDPYDEGIIAYRLLKQANLTTREQQLIRATVIKLDYEHMEEALKRAFGDVVVLSEQSSTKLTMKKIKVEPTEATLYERDDDSDSADDTYYSKGGRDNFRRNNNNRGFSGRGKGSYSKNTYENNKASGLSVPKNKDWKTERTGRLNQRDPKTGEIKTCNTCGSKFHFVRNCPDRSATTMLQSSYDTHMKDTVYLDQEYETILLMNETRNKILIDTGATSTVCGGAWLKDYKESLPKKSRERVCEGVGSKSFRFGDGHVIPTSRIVKIPIYLCGKDYMLETYVIPGDLPLLFSNKSCKEFKVTLDHEKDKIIIKGHPQDLIVTDQGHYLAEIMKKDEAFQQIMLCKETKDTKKIALKLHRYFGHPRSARLVDMIKNSDYDSKEQRREIEEVEKKCKHCIVYRRDTSRPKSTMLSSTDFNDIVCMDLKTLSTGKTFLHVIDLFTRFSATVIIPNKKSETVISSLYKIWITIFGSAKCFFTDNGGEFVNDNFLAMCEGLGIVVRTTAAYAPYSNGVCERHNGLIAESFNKIISDVECDQEIALAWATNAHNSLSNSYGFSPYILVFGRNPNIPGLDNIKLVTTLNESTVSKLLADHLNCMFMSRQAFLKANNSDRLKRALRDRIPNVEEEYFTGDSVYFKKHNQKRWSGPATVIGKDGKTVFIRQGGSILRVHVTKVILQSRADKAVMESATVQSDVTVSESECTQADPAVLSKRAVTRVDEESEYVISESSSDSDSDGDETPGVDDAPETPEVMGERRTGSTDNTLVEENNNNSVSEESFGSAISELREEDSQGRQSQETGETVGSIQDSWETVKYKMNSVLDLNGGDKIRYRENNSDNWEGAVIINAGGRTKGKNKNLFNLVKSSDESTHHIHLDKCIVEKNTETIQFVHYFEDVNVEQTFAVNIPKTRYCDPRIQEAMRKEMEVWDKYEVYREIHDTGQKTLSTRWVVTQKSNDIFKARLVVRGFEEPNVVDFVDSPTGDKCSRHILVTLANTFNWKLESVDIKAAFLQSSILDRAVFIKPPRELKKVGIIWQLEKPAYGLSDSSMNWYLSLKEFLVKIGCICSKLDSALFYYRTQNKLRGMIALHVDDFLIAGDTIFKKDIYQKILKKYDISKCEKDNFKYIGINIEQDQDFISVDQYDYAKNVKIVELSKKRRMEKDSLLIKDEKTQYLSLLGKLSWLSYITRPDLKWDVFNYSRCNKNPTIQNLLDLNGVVSKLNVEKRIRFSKLDMKQSPKLIVYSDASFANLDGKVNSSRGYVIFLCTGDRACIMTWASNKISRVVTSVAESETLGLGDAVRHTEWIRSIIVEMLYGICDEKIIDIICLTDSNQTYQALHSSKNAGNHSFRRDIAVLKEKLASGALSEVRWVANELMLADPLTKAKADSKKLDLVLETGRLYNV